MSFRTSPRADEDIAEAYVAGALRFGEAQAERYQDGLFDAFRMLAANPRMARERRMVEPPMRFHPYEAHMIVYVEEGRHRHRPGSAWSAGLGTRPVVRTDPTASRHAGDCGSLRRDASSTLSVSGRSSR